MTKERLTLGKWGEEAAARYLRKRKFKIIARNFRCSVGEIDIVARHRDVLVFVEVKTKREEGFIPPEASITGDKKRQIIKAAGYYLKKLRLKDQRCRFDVVAVVAGDGEKPEAIRHYPGAFRVRS